MKKNTVLAIVLSSLVIMTSMFIQYKFFPEEENEVGNGKMETVVDDAVVSEVSPSMTEGLGEQFFVVNKQEILEKTYTVETPLVRAVFTNNGGDILSYRLKKYRESSGEEGVEMIKNSLPYNRAFSLALNSTVSPSFDGLFDVKEKKTERGKAIAFIANIKSFSSKNHGNGAFNEQEVMLENAGTESQNVLEDSDEDGYEYRLIKEYEFFDDDYMFTLSVIVEAGTSKKTIENFSYSLRTQTQIGPDWAVGDRYEYRKFSSYSNGSVTNVKISEGEQKTSADVAQWVAIAGKYFALAVLPERPVQNVTYSMKKRDDAPLYDSQIFIRVYGMQGNRQQDVYRIYMGPNSDKFLSKYNVQNNNVHALNDVQVNRIAASGGMLWPLEMVLKFFLENINRLVNNWGVSILIMTLLMRLIFFPLTKKSSKATRKMQEMQPKIKELQEKYKGNPQRLNTEMTMLYQTAGYSPLSGCLPMLIQIPFLFAMFALFNNYFEFRGALFIPGWIPDLSSGDSVWKFGTALPLLGWTDLRLLPIIYVASQLVFGKVTQAGPQDNSNPSMKIMVYAMPLFFFFIFYNAPSGLLLFWTFSNILMLVQQVIINKALNREEMKVRKRH